MAPLALKPTDGAEEPPEGSPTDPLIQEELTRRRELSGVAQVLFAKVSELIPSVPADDDLQKDPELPSLQLSHLECLLYAFHSIAKKVKPTAIDDEVVLKVVF